VADFALGCGESQSQEATAWSSGTKAGSIAMELFIFARFHARRGNESAVAEALIEVEWCSSAPGEFDRSASQ
jgi:hypothetical protein